MRPKALRAWFDGQLKTLRALDPGALPPASSQFIDPVFSPLRGPNEPLVAKIANPHAPVSAVPPSAESLLFARGPLTLERADGSTRTFANLGEYRASVLEARQAAGMENPNDALQQVHLVLQGGGGRGKRYPAAVAEMIELGVIPSSIAGTSAGSIAAAILASGASPSELARFVDSSPGKKMLDLALPQNGGMASGQLAYRYVLEGLEALTGLKDPTFADLKMPLYLVAGKLSDTAPAPGERDLATPDSRRFVFSKESTPHTSVALAVRASMGIPPIFAPVEMTDVASGRTVQLVDGGNVDNFHVDSPHHGLPTLGLSLVPENASHPGSYPNRQAQKPLPEKQYRATRFLSNALASLTFKSKLAPMAQSFQKRTEPAPGQFMLTLPVFDLQHRQNGDYLLQLDMNAADGTLDGQTRAITAQYLAQHLGQMADPTARATNLVTRVPERLSFSRTLNVNGKRVEASYDGGRKLVFQDESGKTTRRWLARRQIEAMWLDDQAFGDLDARLGEYLSHPPSPVRRAIDLVDRNLG